MAFALGYDFGDFDISVGHAIDDQAAAKNDTSTSFVVNGGSGDINFGVFYDNAKVGGTNIASYGVDVGYTMGATSIVVAYGDTDIAGDKADFGIGVSYDLGGGATLGAGVGSVNGKNKADLGVSFKF